MELKDFKTWEETSRWMAKHGYGITQIDIAKEAWEASNTIKTENVVVKEPVTQTAVNKPEVKPTKVQSTDVISSKNSTTKTTNELPAAKPTKLKG